MLSFVRTIGKMGYMRHYTLLDQVCMQIDHALTTLSTAAHGARDNPAIFFSENPLTESERKNSVGCMRVNHTGEVCAQALYRGQLVTCQSHQTRAMLEKSCDEETDHLAWTKKRLDELSGRMSVLNLFFYTNSFCIGILAGLAGDRWSLGFVEETEIQVAKHLENHLQKISEHDVRSRAIIRVMREDEINHEKAAVAAGAESLPLAVKKLMQWHASVMTTLVYYI